MQPKFDIDRIVAYLNPIKDHLPKMYKWNANLSQLIKLNVLTSETILELDNLSPYEKEVKLKKLVREKMVSCRSTDRNLFDELCFWIIRDWGGIKFVQGDRTKELIYSFLERKEAQFDRIASVSKVAAYLFPEEFIIYDSRVAYSLNWILLSEEAGQLYFPIPEGRNSKMTAFDINVLIRLRHIRLYTPRSVEELANEKRFISKTDKKIFLDKDIAYKELNTLIKSVSEKLWADDIEKSTKLFYTEMLLFSIADTDIFLDITTRLSYKCQSK